MLKLISYKRVTNFYVLEAAKESTQQQSDKNSTKKSSKR